MIVGCEECGTDHYDHDVTEVRRIKGPNNMRVIGVACPVCQTFKPFYFFNQQLYELEQELARKQKSYNHFARAMRQQNGRYPKRQMQLTMRRKQAEIEKLRKQRIQLSDKMQPVIKAAYEESLVAEGE